MVPPAIQAVEPPHGVWRTGKSYYSMWNKIVFEIDDKYVPIKPIGSGSYGVVLSALNRRTGEKVAIKKISDIFESETMTKAVSTAREIVILKELYHDNIVLLKDVMATPNRADFNEVYLVYELMDMDLDHIIQSNNILSGDHVKYFIYQILCGLKYLHSSDVIHRDLKPANILVNANCVLKIADLGLARSRPKDDKTEPMTEYMVTRWYRAPELLLGSDNYGPEVDMWSVGCIFAELLGRAPLFPGTNALNQLERIHGILGTQPDSDLDFIKAPHSKQHVDSLPKCGPTDFSSLYPDADPVGLDLLAKMLTFDPRKRISAAEALLHPYIVELYDPRINCREPFQVYLNGVTEQAGEKKMRGIIWNEMLRFHPEILIPHYF